MKKTHTELAKKLDVALAPINNTSGMRAFAEGINSRAEVISSAIKTINRATQKGDTPPKHAETNISMAAHVMSYFLRGYLIELKLATGIDVTGTPLPGIEELHRALEMQWSTVSNTPFTKQLFIKQLIRLGLPRIACIGNTGWDNPVSLTSEIAA